MNEARKPDPPPARAAGRLVDDPSIPVLTERLIVATEAAAAVRRAATAPSSTPTLGPQPAATGSGRTDMPAEPSQAQVPDAPTAIPRSLLASVAPAAPPPPGQTGIPEIPSQAEPEARAASLDESLLITDLSDFDELLQSAAPPGPSIGPGLAWDHDLAPAMPAAAVPVPLPAPALPLQPATDLRPGITAAIENELRSRLSRELPSLIEARLQPQLARISAQAAEQIAVAVSEAMSDALREAIDHAVADALRARRF